MSEFSTTILVNRVVKTDFYTKRFGLNFKQGGMEIQTGGGPNGKPLQNLDFKRWSKLKRWKIEKIISIGVGHPGLFKRPVENTARVQQS
jgi:hypothetical protein